MDVQSQLLFIGSSAKTFKLWWQNEGVRRLAEKPSTPEGVPSRSAVEGHEGSSLKDCSFNAFSERSATTDWQCGQHAKNSIPPSCSQAHKMTFDLN